MVACMQDMLACMQDMLACMEDMVACMQDMLACMEDSNKKYFTYFSKRVLLDLILCTSSMRDLLAKKASPADYTHTTHI